MRVFKKDQVVAAFSCHQWMEGTYIEVKGEEHVVGITGWAGVLPWVFSDSDVKTIEEARAEGLKVEPPYQDDELSDEKKAQVRDLLARAHVL